MTRPSPRKSQRMQQAEGNETVGTRRNTRRITENEDSSAGNDAPEESTSRHRPSTSSRRNSSRRKAGADTAHDVTTTRRRAKNRDDTGTVRRRTEQLPPEIRTRIANDPLFQICTLNGSAWIDPYTGRAIPLIDSIEHTAHTHLLAVPSFKTAQCLPLEQLLSICWNIDVERMIPQDTRFRLFGRTGLGWLNPFSGQWHNELSLSDKKITRHTISQIATILSRCPFAAQGILKSDHELDLTLNAIKIEQKTEQARLQHAAHTESDLQRAKEIQTQSMGTLPVIPLYQCAAFYEGYSTVSGDFYTAIMLDDDHYFFILGDVTGHGVQAAIIVASAMKSLRTICKNTHDLIGIMSELNDDIKPDLLAGQFITAFGAVLNIRTHELHCTLAGHHPCIIANMHTETCIRRLGQRGLAIGLATGNTFRGTLRISSTQLQPGDTLVQYTDGIIEAMDKDQNEYGHHRTLASLITNYFNDSHTLVHHMAQEVTDFAHKNDVGDDLTILAISMPLPDDNDTPVDP